ncbi:MAG TPA: SDR family oxidoreductase [Jatrophihabitans sp.]|nr:SDR family oxidoreductase [Jatrophihabitans sp.]
MRRDVADSCPAPPEGPTRRVRSADGVSLAVYEHGDPARPTVVAVHGYPDNHAVWDGVVRLLADRYRVVTYDVRGTGESDKPRSVSAYRMPRLVDDFVAVIAAVSPDGPVHVLAHDWGSVQCWPALTDTRTASRVESFTSISGPSLDYAAAWMRGAVQHPQAALRQLRRSLYVAGFQLPVLPEAFVRSGLMRRAVHRTERRTRSAAGTAAVPPRTDADQVNGLALYRANMLRGMGSPTPLPTRVPVQVIAPAQDAYVTPALALDSPRPWVEHLVTRTVAGGHWVVSDRPDVIARLTGEFIESLGSAPPPDPPPRSGRFPGQLVVVTGGARGIGRATALAFGRDGADVVVADIDDAAAKETADEIRALGVQAWAEHLDVSDEEQWTSFAADVRARHGVPDIVVNNAGIGMGGPFLGTSVDNWRTLLDVNLWGVIHGCRLFAAQMVERGEGGRIVNIASAAAYAPSIVYPAYATSKAAVLMLSECLRAELEREGILVTAVCPGFVDSDISRTTVHVGVDEQTAQRLREHQIAAYHRRGYSPDRVARRLVDAVADGAPTVIVTPEAKFFRAVSRFAPGLGRRLAKLDLNKL